MKGSGTGTTPVNMRCSNVQRAQPSTRMRIWPLPGSGLATSMTDASWSPVIATIFIVSAIITSFLSAEQYCLT